MQSTNVLIDQYGQAHVADFGLARHIGGYRPNVRFSYAAMDHFFTTGSIV